MAGKLKRLGAENVGTVWEMELKLPPVLNCESRAWLAAAALAKRLPGTFGAIGPLGIVKELRLGALKDASSARAPGNASAKMPAPARITVLSLLNGRQATPILGSQTTA